ncbi:MAG: hypothetical protein RR595_02435 [Lysinibacillus sp.]
MERKSDYIYYLIQVGEQFVANRDCECSFIEDEEQARAFIDITAANGAAIEVDGIVVTRKVRYEELEELSVQQKVEYEAFSKDERNKIAAFCKELAITLS